MGQIVFRSCDEPEWPVSINGVKCPACGSAGVTVVECDCGTIPNQSNSHQHYRCGWHQTPFTFVVNQ